MANEEIKYQINGQLADNTVTADNKEDKILARSGGFVLRQN